MASLALLLLFAACKDAAEMTTESAPPSPTTPAPDAVVAELYDQHTHDRGPFFQTEHRDRVDHFFVKELAELIWKDALESKGEVGALEFDPLYNAQDTDIKNFKIGPAILEGTRARVPVTFDNFGTRTEILYSLEQEGGIWKISDIRWDKETTLRALLAASPQ